MDTLDKMAVTLGVHYSELIEDDMNPAEFFERDEQRQLESLSSRVLFDGVRVPLKTKEKTMAAWTDGEIAKLRQFAEKGRMMQEAADELGRSVTSVQQKASKLEIRFSGHAKRKKAIRPVEAIPSVPVPAIALPIERYREIFPEEMQTPLGELVEAVRDAHTPAGDTTCVDGSGNVVEPDAPAKNVGSVTIRVDVTNTTDMRDELVDTKLRLIGAMVDVIAMPLSTKAALQHEVDRVRALLGRDDAKPWWRCDGCDGTECGDDCTASEESATESVGV